MSALSPSPAESPPSSGRYVRIEYLGMQNVDDHREFRFRAFAPEGWVAFRCRIALAAFSDRRVQLQDGPDVCSQKLRLGIAAGEVVSSDVIMIDDADLVRYREAHTVVVKRRPRPESATPPPVEAEAPPRRPRVFAPRPPVAPPVAIAAEPALEAGQRVSHAVFGDGVTTSSSGGHTVVRFDRQDEPKTFVTSMLEVDVLSAPHTWETGPRGVNRPRRTPAAS